MRLSCAKQPQVRECIIKLLNFGGIGLSATNSEKVKSNEVHEEGRTYFKSFENKLKICCIIYFILHYYLHFLIYKWFL